MNNIVIKGSTLYSSESSNSITLYSKPSYLSINDTEVINTLSVLNTPIQVAIELPIIDMEQIK